MPVPIAASSWTARPRATGRPQANRTATSSSALLARMTAYACTAHHRLCVAARTADHVSGGVCCRVARRHAMPCAARLPIIRADHSSRPCCFTGKRLRDGGWTGATMPCSSMMHARHRWARHGAHGSGGSTRAAASHAARGLVPLAGFGYERAHVDFRVKRVYLLQLHVPKLELLPVIPQCITVGE